MNWDPNLSAEEQFNRVYRGWLGTARYNAIKFGFRGEDVEDLVQSIFVHMWKRDYLGLYDPTKSKFDTFIYVFIRREIFSALRKKSRDVMARSISLVERSSSENESVLTLDTLVPGGNGLLTAEDKAMFNDLVRIIMEDLKTCRVYAYRLYDEVAGVVVERSERQVFLFLLEGTWDRSEMAAAMGCSEGRVAQLVNDLASRDSVRALRNVFEH